MNLTYDSKGNIIYGGTLHFVNGSAITIGDTVLGYDTTIALHPELYLGTRDVTINLEKK